MCCLSMEVAGLVQGRVARQHDGRRQEERSPGGGLLRCWALPGQGDGPPRPSSLPRSGWIGIRRRSQGGFVTRR